MRHEQIVAAIKDIGVVPVVRTSSAESAIKAIQAVYRGGIRAAEITMTVPGAIHALEKLADEFGDTIVLGAGTVLRLLPIERLHHAMQWFCLSGLSLVVCAHYFSNLPFSLYPNVNFWLNSPGLIFIKLGVTMVFVSFSYLWMDLYAGKSWSWVRQLGTTSMLVYWVHIELVYGRWLGGWKENLSVPQTALMAASLIGLMVIVSLGQTKWKAFSAEFAKKAENAPG